MKKLLLILLFSILYLAFAKNAIATDHVSWWPVQSIDTMKYSRDNAAAKLGDSSFDATIDDQIKKIADTGATHVAIATPYDDEFLPILKRWVNSARKYNLHVWFRGNFSGWEKWFGYKAISRDDHLAKTKAFILNNRDLFIDGDIFSACPECENGGPGDPRQTGDIEGHRLFLESEHVVAQAAFDQIGKKVATNYNSMNADVARAIMDKSTTAALGGLVVIDHYVDSPEKLNRDITDIAQNSGGKIFLGEFGTPIPDLNGNQTEDEQATWINTALGLLAQNPNVTGLNYWTSFGGSTKIWNDDGTPRKAVTVLKNYFQPKTISGQVRDQFGNGISEATISFDGQQVFSDSSGKFTIPILADQKNFEIMVSSANFPGQNFKATDSSHDLIVVLTKTDPNLWDFILQFFRKITGLLQ